MLYFLLEMFDNPPLFCGGTGLPSGFYRRESLLMKYSGRLKCALEYSWR